MDPSGKIGFDDYGKPVAVTEFQFPEEGPQSDLLQERAARLETVSRFVQFLLRGNPSAHRLGVRVHLVAFGLGKSPCKQQCDLARKLGVTESAVSANLKSLKQEIAMLSGG